MTKTTRFQLILDKKYNLFVPINFFK